MILRYFKKKIPRHFYRLLWISGCFQQFRDISEILKISRDTYEKFLLKILKIEKRCLDIPRVILVVVITLL